jgi:hypothetical protein
MTPADKKYNKAAKGMRETRSNLFLTDRFLINFIAIFD